MAPKELIQVQGPEEHIKDAESGFVLTTVETAVAWARSIGDQCCDPGCRVLR